MRVPLRFGKEGSAATLSHSRPRGLLVVVGLGRDQAAEPSVVSAGLLLAL